MKWGKLAYIIFDDFEFLIKKIDGCRNNPEKSSTINIGKSTPFRYSKPAIWAFDNIENKHALYCGKDYIKVFFCFFKRKCYVAFAQMQLTLKRENVTINKISPKIASICNSMLNFQKNFQKRLPIIKFIKKLETLSILLVTTEVQHIVYVI